MPPKPKFSKEQIAEAALAIVKEKGLSALTARDLGKRLGTSSSPIFTVFSNMEEVKLAARKIAMEEFRTYISDYREYSPAFKRIGQMMVSYGRSEPELFKLLFMQEHREAIGFSSTLDDLEDIADICVDLVAEDYGFSRRESRFLLEQLWTQTFALGAMCAMRVCDLDEDEISRRLSAAFAGTVLLIKSGRMEQLFSLGSPQKTGESPYRDLTIDDLISDT